METGPLRAIFPPTESDKSTLLPDFPEVPLWAACTSMHLTGHYRTSLSFGLPGGRTAVPVQPGITGHPLAFQLQQAACGS